MTSNIQITILWIETAVFLYTTDMYITCIYVQKFVFHFVPYIHKNFATR